MPKTKISEFSATPANNTDIDSINISEGCAPSGINDAIRELMAQLKDFQTGAVGDSFNGPVGTTTAAAGAFTTLSASGAVTLSGGTANGVAYLNGSKVVTSGSALTFDGTNFATTGSGTLKNLLFSGGTLPAAGNPSIALRSSDNVIYHQSGSANTIVLLDSAQNTMQSIGATANIFNISNSEAMRLTSTGLGIGTSSPAYKLDVNGNAQIGNATAGTNRFLYINGVANKASGIAFQESGTNRWLIGNGAASENGNFEIYDATNGNNFILTRSGNLGLGVTPSAWNSVLKAVSVGRAGSNIYGQTSANLTGVTANAIFDSSDWKYVTTDNASRYQQNGGVHSWYNAPSGTAGNAITFTQAMSLTADGNLLVGNTATAGGRIDVTANSGGTAINIRARTGNDYGFIQFKSNDGATTWGDVYATSAIRLYCDAGGTNGVYLTSGATSWTANSDERLKENLVPIENGLSKVCSLRSVIGNFISDETKTKKPFLIAQDVLAVLPEAVSSGAIPKSEDTTEYLGVAYTEVIPLLVAAIKEQQAIIELLKARLDAANL